MYVKIHSGKKRNNRGSVIPNYYSGEKENLEKELLTGEIFWIKKINDVSFYSAPRIN